MLVLKIIIFEMSPPPFFNLSDLMLIAQRIFVDKFCIFQGFPENVLNVYSSSNEA